MGRTTVEPPPAARGTGRLPRRSGRSSLDLCASPGRKCWGRSWEARVRVGGQSGRYRGQRAASSNRPRAEPGAGTLSSRPSSHQGLAPQSRAGLTWAHWTVHGRERGAVPGHGGALGLAIVPGLRDTDGPGLGPVTCRPGLPEPCQAGTGGPGQVVTTPASGQRCCRVWAQQMLHKRQPLGHTWPLPTGSPGPCP